MNLAAEGRTASDHARRGLRFGHAMVQPNIPSLRALGGTCRRAQIRDLSTYVER
jgi:hypothetical protein